MKTLIKIFKDVVRVACKKCHGQGFIYLPNDTADCDKCEGAGTIEVKGK